MSHKRSRKAFEADLTAKESPFVTYGTPLPALDEDARDDGSYVPIWKQEVTDERGRKRLHGAFTGGFSAGYFNTVGSKEGWTPSAFVSSRSSRHKDNQNAQQQQKPEDFMDEEDLAEAEETRKLETSSAYATFGSTAGDEKRQNLFMDLFTPHIETMGTKLLRRMGWREGQGIGPQIRLRPLPGQDHRKDQSVVVDAFSAPKNSSVVTFNKKTNRNGLGYLAERLLKSQPNTNNDRGSPNRHTKTSGYGSEKLMAKQTPNQRSGFGVGILNSTGSDEDEDPYAMGPKISYTRVIGGEKKGKAKTKDTKAIAKTANPLLRDKPVFISRKAAPAEFRKCHDGRLPISGFLLSSLSEMESNLVENEKYPHPKIPDGWKSQKLSVNTETLPSEEVSTASKLASLDPKSRAALLGEAQLPGKSVFDFLSPAARERIAAASGRSNLPLARGEAIPGSEDYRPHVKEGDSNTVPFLDKATAVAALGRGVGGWMPYSDNEAKRGRYQAFLRYRGEVTDLPPEKPRDVPRSDWTRELEEFVHAAKVFKPMSGAMASRFTSSSSGPNSGSKEPGEGTATPLLSEPQKSEDPAEAAAKMDMFGPMTRSVHRFFPTRLVCKRFNVKPPSHAQADAEASARAHADAVPSRNGQVKMADLVSNSSLDHLTQEAQSQEKDVTMRPSVASSKNMGGIESKIEVDASRNYALEADRAGEAAFKAVFGDDSEDD